MSRHARSIATALTLAAMALIAGCGKAAAPVASGGESGGTAAAASSLATSLDTAAGTWAVAVMGGTAASHNNFWQLFIRPAGSQGWKLVTPPGTADNGGLVLAAAGSTVITAFRPSQYLTYTPLAASGNGGQAWTSTGPLDGALADVPDALAAAPANGQLLALLADGAAELATPGYTRWHSLTTRRAIAATPAGRSCGLRALTAAGYTPSGVPLLAGGCSRPGVAGIFADISANWQAAGPAIPAALSRQQITVLRLSRTATQTVALLAVGSGRAVSVLAAWSADNGRHWTLSPALALDGASPASASFGSQGTVSVIATNGQAKMIASNDNQWETLPVLPSGTAALVPGAGGRTDALAVHRSILTIWQLAPQGTAWTKEQTINVPIQYGSSG